MISNTEPRDKLIAEKTSLGLGRVDIQALIIGAGWPKISTTRIMQIQQTLGLVPKHTLRGRPTKKTETVNN